MINLGLASIPNQSLSVQLDARQYNIDLRECVGIMSASITRDGAALITNIRITAGTPLLPYQYQEAGNFIMTTEGGALPSFDQFGVTQFLLYLSASELAAYRA